MYDRSQWVSIQSGGLQQLLLEGLDFSRLLAASGASCVAGDLFEKLVRLRQYSEQVAARLTRNVLHAVAYMHDVGIVHRDIKPENVMLKEDTSGQGWGGFQAR